MSELDVSYARAVVPPEYRMSKGKKRQAKGRATMCLFEYKKGFPVILRSVSNFLLPEECRAFVKYGESEGFELTRQTATREYAHRNQGRLSIESEEIAEAIFQRCLPFVPAEIDNAKPVGCSANIRLYRYEVGDSFGRHVDQSGDGSKLTALMYLNQEEIAIEGGETIFYDAMDESQVFASFSPATMGGSLVLHGHGARCLTHEASVVTEGTKYVLRTDVLYGFS